MFVGGEFFEDDTYQTEAPTLSTGGMVFLSGGQACLRVIGDCLLARGVRRILLPEYLCPSILTVFERAGLACGFYRVNEDLSLDLDDLEEKAEGCRAMLFINYFGFAHSPQEIAFLKKLQSGGVLLVEDNAQAGFVAAPIGDFVFNSLRKLCAHDGGYLATTFDVSPFLAKYPHLPNPRLPLIRAYRRGLRAYLLEEKGEHADLEELFTRAEQVYEASSLVHGDPQERLAIEQLDWGAIRRIRRENYQYLLRLIGSIPEIAPIYPQLQPENLPLGLPVYIAGVSRDRVNDALGEMEVGLTVHWDALLQHPRTRRNPRAARMASRMLTLTIDQRTTRRQLDYLALSLVRVIEEAREETRFFY